MCLSNWKDKSPLLDSRTADSVRRQAQRELEREKALENQLQQALELKDHYFNNRQVNFIRFLKFQSSLI